MMLCRFKGNFATTWQHLSHSKQAHIQADGETVTQTDRQTFTDMKLIKHFEWPNLLFCYCKCAKTK